MVDKWLNDTGCVARTGGRRERQRQIFIKFASFLKKLKVLKRKRNLAASEVGEGEGLSVETGRIIVPLAKGARKWNHKTFLKKGVLILNGQYDLIYLGETFS
jgi:hypothetical protein